MKTRAWVTASLLTVALGCGNKTDQTVEPGQNHGETLVEQNKKEFPWGPAAPEPPLMPSPVPQLPEQPKSPMNPGDGPKAEDKLIPSTANPATPK